MRYKLKVELRQQDCCTRITGTTASTIACGDQNRKYAHRENSMRWLATLKWAQSRGSEYRCKSTRTDKVEMYTKYLQGEMKCVKNRICVCWIKRSFITTPQSLVKDFPTTLPLFFNLVHGFAPCGFLPPLILIQLFALRMEKWRYCMIKSLFGEVD